MSAKLPGYVRLFSINCRHSYFADGIGRSLELRPSAQCSILLKRYRMLVQSLPGNVAVYYRNVRDAPLANFDETEPLTFTLQSQDSYLTNYTAADQPQAAEVLPSIWYFDNRADQQGLLNPDGMVSGMIRLPLMSRRFSLPLERDVTVETVQIRDNFQQEVWAAKLQPAQSLRIIQLDLSQLSDGRHTLLINGRRQLDFYLSDTVTTRQWGVVALYVGGSAQASMLPQGCVIGADGRVTPRDYVLKLESRKTIWRYTVIAAQGQAPDYRQFAISGRFNEQNETSHIAFSAQPEIFEINGRPAARFASLQTLPLSERPAQGLNLSLHTGDQDMSRTSNVQLPYAQASQLTVHESAAVSYSDMYVYL